MFKSFSARIGIVTILILIVACVAPKATAVFTVTVPPGTDSVVVIGNTPELGGWDHQHAVSLTAKSDSVFSGMILFSHPKEIQFKVTRGSWDQEALNADSLIPGNTNLQLHAGENDVNIRVTAWKDVLDIQPSVRPGTITGTVDVIPQVYSPQLRNYRTVRVWVPPSYSDSTQRQYSVLYCHDGQNIFDPSGSISQHEWQLDETATDLISKGKMESLIIVGIDNNPHARTEEYSPVHLGKPYEDFLVNTLKPMIDSTYRTRPDRDHTYVMGSSMGGIISFDILLNYPQVFSKAFCLSPAFLVDHNEIVKRVRRSDSFPKDSFFLIRNGDLELDAQLQPAEAKMIKAMKKIGMKPGVDFDYQQVKGARHSESDWANQCREFFPKYLGKTD